MQSQRQSTPGGGSRVPRALTEATRRRPQWILKGLLALLVALPGRAAAHPFDTYGAGTSGVALGSAITAAARGPLAAYHNPAGAGGLSATALQLGLRTHRPRLTVNGEQASGGSLEIWELGLAGPAPLGERIGARLGYALLIALPRDSIYGLRQPDERAAAFPLLGSRNQRLVLSAALGLLVVGGLRLGAGVDLLPDVPGWVSVDLGTEGGVTETQIDIEYGWSPRAGAQLDLGAGWTLGATYRRGRQMELELPVQVDVTEGFPVRVQVTGPAYGTPHLLAGGLAWRPTPQLFFATDLTWLGYAHLGQASPTVTILDGEGRATRTFQVPGPGFDNVLSPRVGGEWAPMEWLALRAGYGYCPTPVPPQRNETNLLDADRHVASLGLGWRVPPLGAWGPAEVHVDAFAQLQMLEAVAWEKAEILVGNPGYPTVRAAGQIWSAGLGIRVVP